MSFNNSLCLDLTISENGSVKMLSCIWASTGFLGNLKFILVCYLSIAWRLKSAKSGVPAQYCGTLNSNALQTLTLFHYPTIRSKLCSVKQSNSPQTKVGLQHFIGVGEVN